MTDLWTVAQAAAHWGVAQSRARAILASRGIKRVSGYPTNEIKSVELRQGARTDLHAKENTMIAADTKLAQAIHRGRAGYTVATWPSHVDHKELARELLIAAGDDLAESIGAIQLDGTVLTQRGGGDELDEDAQWWSAEKVMPHLRTIVDGLANVAKILDGIDAISFPWEPRMATWTHEQVARLGVDHVWNESQRLIEQHGLGGADEFLNYHGLPVNKGGRAADVRPVEPYLGAAPAFMQALEAYASTEHEDRYVRVVTALEQAFDQAQARA